MLAQAEVVELLAPVQAKLQAEVGAFLAAKDYLLRAASRARTADEAARVAQLQERQAELEAEAGVVLPPVQRGDYTLDTVVAAASFLARMELHMRGVDRLRRTLPAGGDLVVGLNWSQIALWSGAGLVLLGLVARSGWAILGGGGLIGVGVWARPAA